MTEVTNVREANLDDVPAICSLLTEFRGEEVKCEVLEGQIAAVTSDSNRVIIVLDNHGLKGMAVVNLIFKLPKTEARIDEVVVAEVARGKGYGKILMGVCEAWAWEHGADLIELTSRPSREAANALYQKLGYQLRETNVYTKKGDK